MQWLFDTAPFPARWQCGRWTAGLGWVHIVSDAAIFLAYVALATLVVMAFRRRPDWPQQRLGYLFGAFILSCGVGHLLEAAMFWWPAYYVTGTFKAWIALVSVITAAELSRFWPKLETIPNLDQLADRLNAGEFAQLQLSGAIQKLRNLIDSSPIVAWTLDSKAHLSEGFSGWVRYTGLSGAAAHGMSWLLAFHPDDRAALTGLVQATGASAVKTTLSTRAWHAPTGRFRHVEVHAWHLPASGAGESEWLMVLDDIDRAVESETRFHLAFEACPAAMIMVNAAGRIVLANRAAERIFRYSRSDLLGKPLSVLIPEQHRRAHEAHWEGFRQSPSARAMSGRRDLNGQRSDGTLVPIEAALNPVWMDGELNVLAVVQDATEKRSAEADQQKFTSELLALNQSLDQFVYAASHDLRAPLRGIRHLVDWIEEGLAGQCPPSVGKDLETLRGRVTRMDALLTGLLEYSRAGKRHGSVSSIDLNEMVEEIVETLDVPAGFQVIRAGDLPRIITEHSPLYQVLFNLIANALRHHDKSTGQVMVGATVDDGVLDCSVTDDGPGIPEEHRERVFQMFETLRPRDEVEGTGIGLALVRKVVDGNGGTIHLSSGPGGRGCVFQFTWPVVRPVAA